MKIKGKSKVANYKLQNLSEERFLGIRIKRSNNAKRFSIHNTSFSLFILSEFGVLKLGYATRGLGLDT